MHMHECVCVRVCVLACVRACVCVCVIFIKISVTKLNNSNIVASELLKAEDK